ncbi:sulfotransferase family 2 domain-containing protein [Candidatus Albibeggiatoa sp. nov. BB20]|uniref:sulfotransferase family 2 domain-containing protein n=1 Tax=Candidatus Albibeggiatoa sp. nov. BB20 TaxID=3162723 RepID=UPI003365582D
MLVSHTKKFIYTKTRKTAGTSIEVYFEKYCLLNNESSKTEGRELYMGDTGIVGYRSNKNNYKGEKKLWGGHASADFIKGKIGMAIWDEYFKFCAIRNPFDKMVSMFYFNARKKDIKWDIFDKKQHATIFKNWLFEIGKDRAVDRDKYIINGQVCIDYFIRYEAIEEGIEHVCQTLDIPFLPDSIPQLKSQFRQSALELSDYYDYSSIEMVRNLFAFELDYFNYSFPHQKAQLKMTENLLNQAIAAFKTKNLYQAEQFIRQILAIDANHAEALNLLGVIAIETKHFAEAEQCIKHAIAVKDNVVIFHENLANLYFLQKKLQKQYLTIKKCLLCNLIMKK